MKQRILESLGYTFSYDPSVVKIFLDILNVRFGNKSEIKQEFDTFLTYPESVKELLSGAYEQFTTELKRLNQMNLQSRLEFLERYNTPETVVIRYMKILFDEIARQSYVDVSSELIDAEEQMFTHLLNHAQFNEDKTELEGISNLNVRLVLQTWALYPEYQKRPEPCKEFLEALELTNVKL